MMETVPVGPARQAIITFCSHRSGTPATTYTVRVTRLHCPVWTR